MRSAPPLSRHPILLLAFAFIVFGTLIEAQTPTSSSAPTATLSYASIVPSTTSYTYTGCYNETTGDAAAGDVRALAGGSMNASDTMTVELCLQFCGSYTYAGLEYGRECWCSSLLNSNSVKLPDANCTLRCSGDQSEAYIVSAEVPGEKWRYRERMR
ncbi:hypothetical protein MMC08_009005 [Hypocenomyce scalaris]|nr:hypothetical protein [Hypocenomyce scalaris]